MRKNVLITIAALSAVVITDIAYLIFAVVKRSQYISSTAAHTDGAFTFTVIVIILNALVAAAIGGYFVMKLVAAKRR
ncbi:MAG: hypothetical protein LBT20_01865 [Clostridiales bacterium]|jgi:hypothetical protein|nr:hypothetical protein [Clostridiales bacterium]